MSSIEKPRCYLGPRGRKMGGEVLICWLSEQLQDCGKAALVIRDLRPWYMAYPEKNSPYLLINSRVVDAPSLVYLLVRKADGVWGLSGGAALASAQSRTRPRDALRVSHVGSILGRKVPIEFGVVRQKFGVVTFCLTAVRSNPSIHRWVARHSDTRPKIYKRRRSPSAP